MTTDDTMRFETALRPYGLFLSGIVDTHDLASETAECLALISPDEPRFWQIFSTSPEYQDQLSNPLDRWSERVISAIATEFSGHALFPFGGPPFAPFLDYARKSDRGFASPLGLIVHAERGLMISYRGAVALPFRIASKPAHNPCHSCREKPCMTACPVNAFEQGFYDTAICKAHLNSTDGSDCRQNGCKLRARCPLSTQKRLPEQNMHHMRYFAP